MPAPDQVPRGNEPCQMILDRISIGPGRGGGDYDVDGGRQELVWNGLDDGGRPVSSGMYVYKLESANVELTRRMVLVR